MFSRENSKTSNKSTNQRKTRIFVRYKGGHLTGMLCVHSRTIWSTRLSRDFIIPEYTSGELSEVVPKKRIKIAGGRSAEAWQTTTTSSVHNAACVASVPYGEVFWNLAARKLEREQLSPHHPLLRRFFCSRYNLRAAKMRKSSSYGNACYAGYAQCMPVNLFLCTLCTLLSELRVAPSFHWSTVILMFLTGLSVESSRWHKYVNCQFLSVLYE